MAFSPAWSFKIKWLRASRRSGHSPQGRPPYAQTTCPVRIQIPISYLIPGPWNLWEYHLGLNGEGSIILKSVPSIETKMLEHLGALWKRFSQSIYNCLVMNEIHTFSSKEFNGFLSHTTDIFARRRIKMWHHLRKVLSETPTRIALICSLQYRFKCYSAHKRCSGRTFAGRTWNKLQQHTQLGMSQKRLGIYDNLCKYCHPCHVE